MFIEVIKVALGEVAQRAFAFYRQYPARSISYVVSAVVAIGGFVGVGVDAGSVTGVLSVVLPILLGGEAIHWQVTPVPNSAVGAKPNPVLTPREGDVDANRKRG